MKFRLPDWLKKTSLKLPGWAWVSDDYNHDKMSLKIVADPAIAYPEWFALLHDEKYPIPLDMAKIGITHMPDVDVPDQYWLEVAYQCTKLDLQSAIVGTPYDPRLSGKNVEFKFQKTEKYAHKNWPAGKTAEVASQGKQARLHYIRVRGSLPM